MKQRNIAILGTIGCGKTTLIEKIRERLAKETSEIIVQPEPSVTIPFVNDVLKKFYNDNSAWSYSLQLCIAAAQEAHMRYLTLQ